MSRLFDYIADAVRSPREQLSRGQHFVRHSWELTAHCWRQLQRHRAEGMAAELTYRTIFALIPVVVLGLVMFRIVGGLDQVENKVENQLFSFFGVPEIPAVYLPQDQASDPEVDSESNEAAQSSMDPADTDPDLIDPERIDPDAILEAVVDIGEAISVSEEADQGLTPENIQSEQDAEAIEKSRREARASIRRTLHDVTAKVASVDFKSVGVVGLLLFIYAAVALADATEHLFNRIYDAPSHRPIHIRLAIQWSIITLGGGLLTMSLYMSGQVVEWFGEIGAGSNSRLILSHLLSVGASWVLLFLLYALMPNTHVSVRSAAIGSLVGSLLWEGAKFGFQFYVAKAVPYSAIYGSIGLIPLFLFWIYVTWLIVLFGLILTYTLQSLRGRLLTRIDRQEDTLPAGDPDWMLPIMCEVGHAFHEGTAINNQELADRIGLSSRIVHDMTGKLVEADMLRRVTSGAGEEDALTLARPADTIVIREILELAHRVRPTNGHPAWKTLASLKQAERDAADGKTLADIQDW